MGIGPGTGPGGARCGAGRPKGGAGRPKGATNKRLGEEELKRLARRNCRAAIKRIRDIMDNGEDDKVRLSAAREMLDRGFGKPAQSMKHGGPDGGPIPFTFDMTGAANEKGDE